MLVIYLYSDVAHGIAFKVKVGNVHIGGEQRAFIEVFNLHAAVDYTANQQRVLLRQFGQGFNLKVFKIDGKRAVSLRRVAVYRLGIVLHC